MAESAGAAMVGRESSGRYAGWIALLTVEMAETNMPKAVFFLSLANATTEALPEPLGRPSDWVSDACRVGVEPAAEGVEEELPKIPPIPLLVLLLLPITCGKIALKTEDAISMTC